MRVRTKPLKKAIIGGHRRRTSPAITRYAQSNIPDSSNPARAFITDFCLVRLDKSIDLALFDDFATAPGHTDYTGMAKIADIEKQTFL